MIDDELGPPPPPQPLWLTSVLRQPLSAVQTLVGILAGALTIGGGVLSVTGFSSAAPSPPPRHGELVTLVQDARSRQPVMLATVEIFTPQDALVTTLTVQGDGRLVRRLKEGQYRIRVTHPAFGTEVRRVEVHTGQSSELRIALGVKPALPAASPRPVAAITTRAPASREVAVVEPAQSRGPGPVEKFFKDMVPTETSAP